MNEKNKENEAPLWERRTRFILGPLILFSGIYQTLFGERTIGILILICYALITVPGFFTRNFIKKFPVEIEILLFIMVLFQFVLGEVHDFYTNIPYYDKIVHYMLPMFLGIIGFLIFYSLYVAGRLKTSISAMMLIIVLITMGIGAGWEIIEYSSDIFLYPRIENWHHYQGNAQQDPHNDTMTDLIADTLGGVFGALLGLWIMTKSYGKKEDRRTALLGEVGDIFAGKSKNPPD